jgi:hypothetical protein
MIEFHVLPPLGSAALSCALLSGAFIIAIAPENNSVTLSAAAAAQLIHLLRSSCRPAPEVEDERLASAQVFRGSGRA